MQALERVVESDNWLAILLLTSFVLMFFLSLYSREKLKGYVGAVFNKGFIEVEATESKSLINLFHFIFTVFSFIAISLLSFFLMSHFIPSFEFSLKNYAYLAGILGLYVGGRFFLEHLLVLLFNLRVGMSFFLYSKRSYMYFVSIGLTFLLVIYYYGFFNIKFLIIASSLLFLFRLILLLVNNKNLIIKRLFYFILYLCAFEIAPLLVIIKLVILE